MVLFCSTNLAHNLPQKSSAVPVVRTLENAMIDPTDFATRPLPVTSSIVLYFQSSARVYRAELGRDLLDDWTVMLTWSGKGTRRGGFQVKFVADAEAGIELLRTVIKKRERRGYQLLSAFSADLA
jgi:hypothetical protein